MRAARLLAALALTGLTGLGAGAPAAAAPSPSPSPGASSSSPPPEAPLRITVTDLRPRAPRPGDALEVAGVLTNDGTQEITSVSVRLRVGQPVVNRGGLHDADTDRPLTTPRTTTRVSLPEPLAAGAHVRFDLRTTVEALGLKALGVYPVDVEARGDLGDGVERLGLAPTWVPWFGSNPVKRTRVAVVWPLVDAPRQSVDGHFRDDTLATELSGTGRLGRLLQSARAAETRECGDPAHGPGDLVTPAPTRCEPVPVTYAIDPDLLGAATAMTAAYRVGGPRVTTAGTGTPSAVTFLAQLREGAAHGDVLALPYGDPDVTALTRQPESSGFLTDLSRAGLLGTEAVRTVLGVRPETVVAFPPSGRVTARALDALALSGATSFVLDPSAFGQPDSEPYPTPGTRALLPSSSLGTTPTGLVTEPYLSDLVTGELARDLGPRLAEQRFLAETAIIAAEKTNLERTLVIAPERRGDAVTGAAAAALRDLGRVPWLCPVRLVAVAAGTEHCAGTDAPTSTDDRQSADRGPLSDARTGELANAYLKPIGQDRQVADQLTGAVLSDQADSREKVAAITARLRRAIARAESSAWREDVGTGTTQARLLHHHLTDLVGRVTVYGGQVLLTSTAGRLQASLENRLDVPIRVRVLFADPGAAIDPARTGILEVTPGNAVPAVVSVETHKSGQYVVNAEVLDRNGQPFPLNGPQVARIVVRSTGYGRLALAVTIGGAGVLFVAAGVRIVRRAVRRG